MSAASSIVEALVPYAVCFGTRAEIEAIAPSTEYAFGNASDFGQMNFVRGVGWSTNKLGSPSNPYPTTADRNAVAPFAASAVVWVTGSLIPIAYMLANGSTGSVDDDWIELSGGSSAVAYGDLT